MITRALPLILLTLLGGCAAQTAGGRWVFEKASASEDDVKRDRCECFASAVSPYLDRAGLVKVDRDAYRACMEQRGYTLRIVP